jgi:hypothetical protein
LPASLSGLFQGALNYLLEGRLFTNNKGLEGYNASKQGLEPGELTLAVSGNGVTAAWTDVLLRMPVGAFLNVLSHEYLHYAWPDATGNSAMHGCVYSAAAAMSGYTNFTAPSRIASCSM